MYVKYPKDNNVPSRLSPKWLYGNSWTWARDVRLHIVGKDCFVESPECYKLNMCIWILLDEYLCFLLCLLFFALRYVSFSRMFTGYVSNIWGQFLVTWKTHLVWVHYDYQS